MIFNLYIFNSNGRCLYYEAYHRPRTVNTPDEDKKLMFGLLFSLKNLVNQLAPTGEAQFRTFKTNTYKCHYYETATGLMFVLLSDPATPDLREQLKFIYSDIYVQCVARNPLATPSEPITADIFKKTLNKYVK